MTKNRGKAILISLIAAAVFLIVIGVFFGKTNSGEKNQKEIENEIACFLENTEGVGNASVRLCFDENGKICGAAVVCSGGKDAKVCAAVINLLSASLGIGTNHIYVTASG